MASDPFQLPGDEATVALEEFLTLSGLERIDELERRLRELECQLLR
jgi:hypothetical protein